jgi:tripartite-type tricarboxylate transporter receptor subunit TctC
MKRAFLAITAAALACAAGGAPAQPYPAKPVRVIVGFPPSSAADITARVVGQRLGAALGHPIVVENRPGAGSNIAADLSAKAAPDGYTLFTATVANAINATLYPRLPFDFARDFAPVALAAATPNVLVVHPSVPARSVEELIALAKRRPRQLTYASAGVGTVLHMSAELFKAMAGVDMVHVPFQGSPPAVTSVMAGEVMLMFAPSSTVIPHVASGRLRALAVTTSSRLASLPDLPTVAAAGLAGFETVLWMGFVAPAKTPEPIVARLNAEVGKALALPEVRQNFAAQGIETLGGTPADFAAYIREDIARWAKVIRSSGARAE